MADKKLLIKLAADVESLKKDMRKARAEVDSFSNDMKKVGASVAAAFSAQAVGSFVLEISKLSGQAQGVREAFDRLPNSVKVMHELKEATHGTVSELDLMKRAVMASNFDISLQALPRLLEFATLRAKQTGQSIDYLVDSIVTGIGRKSKLILDNLGISAVQLTEALGGASTASSTIGEVADAVGKIAKENLKKMGTLSENASTKLERLNASWINMKVAMGDAANGTGILGNSIDALTASMDVLSSRNLSFWEKLTAMVSGPGAMTSAMLKNIAEDARKLAEDQKLGESITRQASQAIKTFGNNLEAIESAYKQNIHFQKIMNEINRLLIEDAKKKETTIRNEKNLLEELNGLREDAALAVGRERLELNRKIEATEKEIDALQRLGKEVDKMDDYRQRMEDYYMSLSVSKSMSLGEYTASQAQPTPKKKASEAMDEASKSIGDQLDKLGEKSKETNEQLQKDVQNTLEAYARLGDAIGNTLGDVVVGSKTLAEAMREMAVQAIATLQRVIILRMAANPLTSPLSIAAVAAGFGFAKSLFGGIGRDNNSPTSPNYKGYNTWGVNASTRTTTGSSNVMQLVVRGTDLIAVQDNTKRMFGRTKVSYIP